MNVLEVSHLGKSYHNSNGEVVAIDDVSFSIDEGEVVSIVGPSGCGKSTILSILAGIIDKSSGEVYYLPDICFSYMLQDDCLLPFRTILDNCLIGLEVKGILNEDNKEYVLRLLNLYGLGDFIYKYPSSLSGGMRQRVALIRTLAIQPDILLLDEATSALDYQSKLLIENDIYKIIKNEGITTIMVTHDIGQAISMSDRVIVLSNRPATVKKIIDININGRGPIDKRKCSKFNDYFDLIWGELNEN